MFTELDGFTEAPGKPHFIFITKDMRKLSWTAVSTYCSKISVVDFWNRCLIPFWNRCLIPCYWYHFMFYWNYCNHCARPHVLCRLHDQPHPLCSFWLLRPGSFKLTHLLLMLLVALSQCKKQIRDHGLSTQNQ